MKISFILMLIGVSFCCKAQSKVAYNGYPSLIWPKLDTIQYMQSKDELGDFQKPIFSNDVKVLEGKPVTLPGYIVPFETGTTKSKQFILTSLPLTACFFCGVGGPETVVEVILKNPIQYTEKLIDIKGTLRLNSTDPDKMIYRLEQAEYLGEIDF
jgi:hypothetical protein